MTLTTSTLHRLFDQCEQKASSLDPHQEWAPEIAFIQSLQEVKKVEAATCKAIASLVLAQSPQSINAKLQRAISYTHLLTIPVPRLEKIANEQYNRAWNCSNHLPHKMLENIYRVAWTRIPLDSTCFELDIFYSVPTRSFPLYAFKGLCDGLIDCASAIEALYFPFYLEAKHLTILCSRLSGKTVNTLTLLLKEPLLDSLKLLQAATPSCTIGKLVLPRLSLQARQLATTWSIEAGVPVEFSRNA